MMGRTRQWAVLIFFSSSGFLMLVLLLWLELTPAELPAPFIGLTQRIPTLALPKPTSALLADQPRLTIAAKPYRHPSGAFSVKYPEGWQIDEAEDAVLFAAPDDSAQYSVTVKEGVTATPDPRRYVQSGWGGFPNFALEGTLLSDGVAFHFEQNVLPEKTWQLMKGQTLVKRHNRVAVWQTWVMRLDKYDVWREAFTSLNNSLTFNPPQ